MQAAKGALSGCTAGHQSVRPWVTAIMAPFPVLLSDTGVLACSMMWVLGAKRGSLLLRKASAAAAISRMCADGFAACDFSNTTTTTTTSNSQAVLSGLQFACPGTVARHDGLDAADLACALSAVDNLSGAAPLAK
jgi:hypothetical protein